ncbi:MAG: glutaminyl-peptide cyclotransferase [Anaerolineae bacterium]|nr:glutaminyl-peptide cyclotransferase [Anaerolineae bacterium]
MKRLSIYSSLLFLILVNACQPQSAQLTTPLLPTQIPSTATAVPIPTETTATSTSPVIYTYEIINSYPHDPNAFTQGLIYVDDVLYEGTGRNGQSSLREVDLETGVVQNSSTIPEQYFGEGITVFNDKIYQLTWKNQTGFIYDQDSFELLGTFSYPTEGWGLTHDGEQLIMSDGTNNLYFLDPDTLEIKNKIPVFDENGNPVMLLNELEYINGDVYANVWQTNRIARINPTTGQVTAWIDLTGILSPDLLTQPVDVLNGIAYDAENGRLFVTGKLWPTLFEIKLVKTAVATQ